MFQGIAVPEELQFRRSLQLQMSLRVEVLRLAANFVQNGGKLQRLSGEATAYISAGEYQQVIDQPDEPVTFIDHVVDNVGLFFFGQMWTSAQQAQVAAQRGERGA